MIPGNGPILATYDNSERARIRAVLIAYMKENRSGAPWLHKRICASERDHEAITLRTLQRVLDGKTRVNDGNVGVCARFATSLPNQRLETHRLADALHSFYGHDPDRIGGVYRVSTGEAAISELTIQFPPDSRKSYIVTERATGRLSRVHDGSLVFTGPAMLAILKDRLMRTARVHMLHLNRDKKTFYGLVYDNGPLASGGMPYQLLQTTLERIGNAE